MLQECRCLLLEQWGCFFRLRLCIRRGSCRWDFIRFFSFFFFFFFLSFFLFSFDFNFNLFNFLYHHPTPKKVWQHNAAFKHPDVTFLQSLHAGRSVSDLLIWAETINIANDTSFQKALLEYFGRQVILIFILIIILIMYKYFIKIYNIIYYIF